MSSLSTPLSTASEQQESSSPLKQQPQKPSDLDLLNQDLYAQMFKQLDYEAYATLITALLITMLFWLVIFLTNECGVNFLHMPLWFVLSCIGGYILSVISVIVLVKYFLKEMPLHPTSHTSPKDQASTTSSQAQIKRVSMDTTTLTEQLLKPSSSDSHH